MQAECCIYLDLELENTIIRQAKIAYARSYHALETGGKRREWILGGPLQAKW